MPPASHFTLSQVVPKLNQKGKDLIQVIKLIKALFFQFYKII